MPYIAGIYTDTRGYYAKGTFNPWPYNPDESTDVYNNPSAEFWSDNKPAIKINLKDPSGWRSPSAYFRTVEKVSEFYGEQLVWLSDNPTYDGYARLNGFIGNTTWMPTLDTTYPTATNNMVRRAEVECLTKLKNQNVNYAVALAEAHKASGMISKSVLELANAYRFARAGAWKRALGVLGIHKHTFRAPSKEFSKRWLELQYGWLPLLSDLYGAYEDARKGLVDYNPRISVSRAVFDAAPVPAPYTTKYGVRVSTTQSESVYGVKVRLDYTLNSDAIKTASKVGLTNPALVAWELVPFSFVVDWIAPVGNWLDAFDADWGLTFKGGTKTLFSKINRIQKAFCFTSKRGANVVGSCSAEALYHRVSMSRTVYESPPIPTPYVKNPFSVKHAANALALLRGFFSH